MKKILLFGFFFMALGISDAQNSTYCTTPTDPLFYPYQWGLKNDGQLLPWNVFGELQFTSGVDISACEAWQYSEGEVMKKVVKN